MTRAASSGGPGRVVCRTSVGLGALLVVSGVSAQPATERAGDGGSTVWCDDCVRPASDPVQPFDDGDGVYGRLDGDLDVGIALGSELEKGACRAAAHATLHYFWTAGVYASYRDGFDREEPDVRRVSVGVDLRPLFIPRWSQHWEMGPPLLDLTLDSASLSLGAYWGSAAAEACSSRGLELGLGFGVPLYAQASGPWLGARGLMRWPEPMLGGHELSALLTLQWHWLVTGPVVR